MKVISHDEKSNADCLVRANGNSVQEFATCVSAAGDTISSWIPFQDGQKITIEAGCTVCTREVRFDLVIDGITRATQVMSSKECAAKRRHVKFLYGFDMVNGAVTEVDLVAKALPADADIKLADGEETVGTIEVRLWVLQKHDQLRVPGDRNRFFVNCSKSRDLDAPITYTSIKPTHELDLVPSDFNPMPSVKITNAKKYMTAARPGSQPWVVFRFFYRNQTAINEGGLTMTPKLTGRKTLKWVPPIASANAEREDLEFETGSEDKTVVKEATTSFTHSDLGALDLGSHKVLTANDTSINGPEASNPAIHAKQFKQEPLPLPKLDLGLQELSGGIKKIKDEEHSSLPSNTDTMAAKSRKTTPAHRGKPLSTALDVSKTPTPKNIVISAARDEHIKEYESTIGPIDDFGEEAKDELLKHHQKNATPDPESQSEVEADEETESKVNDITDLMSTPTPSPVATKMLDLKRKASSLTPDPAFKKENDERAKKIAEMQKLLSERTIARIALAKKAEDEEAKRKEQQERQLAELEAALAQEEQMIEELEAQCDESASMRLAESRALSMAF